MQVLAGASAGCRRNTSSTSAGSMPARTAAWIASKNRPDRSSPVSAARSSTVPLVAPIGRPGRARLGSLRRRRHDLGEIVGRPHRARHGQDAGRRGHPASSALPCVREVGRPGDAIGLGQLRRSAVRPDPSPQRATQRLGLFRRQSPVEQDPVVRVARAALDAPRRRQLEVAALPLLAVRVIDEGEDAARRVGLAAAARWRGRRPYGLPRRR